MQTEEYRATVRAILERMLADSSIAVDKHQLLDTFADELTLLQRVHAHQILNEIIDDARTRIDARLSPDPVRQTIATVQSTVQDLWKSIWGP
jgi:hypothetical protein